MPKITLPLISIKLFLLTLFTLVTGLAAGMFLGSLLPGADRMYLFSLLQSSNSGFLPMLVTNLMVLGLISFSGFSVYGFPMALLLLFTRAFSTGFCDSLLIYNVDNSGLLPFIFTFMLPQILLCIIYLAVTAASVSYALTHLQNKNAPVTVR